MPTYTFLRPDGQTFTKRLSFQDFHAIQAGKKMLEDADGTELPLVFNPGAVGFVLKDGESGGWPSKAVAENKYRREHREVMAKRERDHVFKSRLVPNYKGREAHNWSDVQDHVRTEKGKLAASTYDHLVSKESRAS